MNPDLHLITLNKEFHEMTSLGQVNHLHKLASSLNHALDLMQNERNDLLRSVDYVKTQLGNCQKALDIQKGIVRNTLTDDNISKQEFIKEIQDLQKQVRDKNILLEEFSGKV